MKNTCRLCGGKLRGGICTECGMDNRKSDEMYESCLNQSQYDHAAVDSLSHVHTSERKAENYKQPALNVNHRQVHRETGGQKNVQNTQSIVLAKKIAGKTARNSKNSLVLFFILATLVVLVVVAVIGSSIGNTVSDNSLMSYIEDYEGFDFDYDYFDSDSDLEDYDYQEDFSDYLTILPEGGEHWESELCAGMYLVGVDIPEGEYRIDGQKGNTIEVNDREHSIYIYEDFGSMSERQIEGLPLFKGTVVSVEGMNPLLFTTENGQTQDLEARIDNPLTDTIEVSGRMTAGVDFPAGTYDVQAGPEDFGYVSFEIPYKGSAGDGETAYYCRGAMLEKNPTEAYSGYSSVYKNMVFPEGTVVDASDYRCLLVPSTGIVSEDYQGYYDNIY